MILHTFIEFISNNTRTFRELLPSNTTHFSRHQTIMTFSKSYWQTILQTFPDFILLANNTDTFRELLANNFFPEFISNNINIFRELLGNNTTHFSRVYIKQYCHFQRVPSNLNYSKNFFRVHTTQY